MISADEKEDDGLAKILEWVEDDHDGIFEPSEDCLTFAGARCLASAYRKLEETLVLAKSGGCFCSKHPELEDAHLGTCPQLMTKMNQAFADKIKELIARTNRAETALQDVTKGLTLAIKIIETADAYDSFDCPHLAEDRCRCGDTQMQLAKEWNLAKIAYDKFVATTGK